MLFLRIPAGGGSKQGVSETLIGLIQSAGGFLGTALDLGVVRIVVPVHLPEFPFPHTAHGVEVGAFLEFEHGVGFAQGFAVGSGRNFRRRLRGRRCAARTVFPAAQPAFELIPHTGIV